MERSQSERIVRFIGSLLPLYDMEYGADACRARHLASGITLDVIDESAADEELGLIQLRHPASGETWTVEGRMLVTEALKHYVDLHGFGLPEKARRQEFRRMCDHFAFKTGAYAYTEWEDEQTEALAMAGRVVRALGKEVAMSGFKSLIGLS
jgi:hypothetical protein